MEEDKIQRLHDSLSKLRKHAVLGVSSHFNFGGGSGTGSCESTKRGESKNGELIRDDGLPVNALYSNFVKEGLYDPTKRNQNDAAKYGDGRFIKRNFDDSISAKEEKSDDFVSSSSSGDRQQRKRKQDKKRMKEKEKKKKKEEKKAAKLIRKKELKLEEKRRAKKEAKRLAKKL